MKVKMKFRKQKTDGILLRTVSVASMLLLSSFSFAATKVTGVVKNEKGEPLIGVTVVEVGTNKGTVTDAEGHYVLDVDNNARLKFTYLGHEPRELKAETVRKSYSKKTAKCLMKLLW